MNASNKYLWITIVVLSITIIVLLYFTIRKPKTIVVEKHFTDTVTVVKVDTIIKYRTKYIKERITDTIYVKKGDEDKVALPRAQRHFREKSLYDAWISGYDPLLDSIKIYPKTEYTTITNTITKEVTPLTWKLYAGLDLQAISGDFAPCVSVTLATPKKWLISAKIGVYEKEPIYGLGVSYKIFEK